MTDNMPCPMCVKSPIQRFLKKGEGILAQSGEQHLRTTTYECECGFKHWEPARDTTQLYVNEGEAGVALLPKK
jgi:hypothetical protein